MTEDDFSLQDLSDERLDIILSLESGSLTNYIHNLIKKYYKNIVNEKDIILDQSMYEKLQLSYSSSFMVEKLLRNNDLFKAGYTPVYTKTGLIVEIVNDLYFNEEHLVHH